MNKVTTFIHAKKAVVLAALVAAPALGVTASAQASPVKVNRYVAVNRADIIAKKNPAVYDGPRYGWGFTPVFIDPRLQSATQFKRVFVGRTLVEKAPFHSAPTIKCR